MALDKTCKERQRDSPREEHAHSIESNPQSFSLLCLLSICAAMWERQGESESDGKHACRLTFENSPAVMVFPRAASAQADLAFKAESNRCLLRLRL